jgi:hypothetical protein
VVKQLPAVLAPHLDLEREIAEEFDDLRHVIVVLGEQFALSLWVKEVFRRQ